MRLIRCGQEESRGSPQDPHKRRSAQRSSPALAQPPVQEHRRNLTKGRVRYLTEAEEARLRTALIWRDESIKAARARANAWRRARGYVEMPSIEIQAYGDRLTPMVLLTLNTGLRRGELFKLRWEDMNV